MSELKVNLNNQDIQDISLILDQILKAKGVTILDPVNRIRDKLNKAADAAKEKQEETNVQKD